MVEKNSLEKQADKADGLKKIFETKSKDLEREVSKLKKQIKDAEASHKRRHEDTVAAAMKSASVAILTAKINMAKEAKATGITIWADDLKDWEAKLAEHTGGKKAEDKPAKDPMIEDIPTGDIHAEDKGEAKAGEEDPEAEGKEAGAEGDEEGP